MDHFSAMTVSYFKSSLKSIKSCLILSSFPHVEWHARFVLKQLKIYYRFKQLVSPFIAFFQIVFAFIFAIGIDLTFHSGGVLFIWCFFEDCTALKAVKKLIKSAFAVTWTWHLKDIVLKMWMLMKIQKIKHIRGWYLRLWNRNTNDLCCVYAY